MSLTVFTSRSRPHACRHSCVSSSCTSAWPYRGSDRQPASSIWDSLPQAAECVSAPKEKSPCISCAMYRTRHRKYPAYGRLPARTTKFSLLQGKNNLLFGESWFFHRHHLRSGSVDLAGILFLNSAGFRVRVRYYKLKILWKNKENAINKRVYCYVLKRGVRLNSKQLLLVGGGIMNNIDEIISLYHNYGFDYRQDFRMKTI